MQTLHFDTLLKIISNYLLINYLINNNHQNAELQLTKQQNSHHTVHKIYSYT